MPRSVAQILAPTPASIASIYKTPAYAIKLKRVAVAETSAGRRTNPTIERQRMVTHSGLYYAQAMESAAADMDIVRELMHDIDRTLLRENLRLTPEQRLAKFASFMRVVAELGSAGEKVRRSAKPKT